MTCLDAAELYRCLAAVTSPELDIHRQTTRVAIVWRVEHASAATKACVPAHKTERRILRAWAAAELGGQADRGGLGGGFVRPFRSFHVPPRAAEQWRQDDEQVGRPEHQQGRRQPQMLDGHPGHQGTDRHRGPGASTHAAEDPGPHPRRRA